MADYEFELTFQLQEEESGEQYLNSLVEAGCDDAIVGFGKSGVLGFDFSRAAPDATEAISSAIRAVKSVIPNARLIEAGPDLVGLTDMGEIFGVSRQHMRKFILEHHNAPPPVHSGNPKLWHLSDISDWMSSINAHIRGAGISRECAELARTTLAVNFARRWLALQPPDLAQEEVIKAADRELPKQVRIRVSNDALRHIA